MGFFDSLFGPQYTFKGSGPLGSVYGGKELEFITMDPRWTSYGNSCFEEYKMRSILLSDSLTSIGSSCFYHCENLERIDIPDGVTEIGESAFFCCKSLKEVKLPSRLKVIPHDAFYGCDSLTTINIPNGVKEIGSSAFRNCTSLTSIKLPDGLLKIGEWAFRDCNSLKEIVIPNSVTEFEDRCFEGTGIQYVFVHNAADILCINLGIPSYISGTDFIHTFSIREEGRIPNKMYVMTNNINKILQIIDLLRPYTTKEYYIDKNGFAFSNRTNRNMDFLYFDCNIQVNASFILDKIIVAYCGFYVQINKYLDHITHITDFKEKLSSLKESVDKGNGKDVFSIAEENILGASKFSIY